ncbi:titin-like isoform X2 [Armigeres subalbatus]|uniref:titin-like isoform X2 n=1 Tax=Armigeres subalbatus TaxID=124917 RepID=UPI002ED2801C
MLTMITLLLVTSVLRTAALNPPPNDPRVKPVRTMLLPTVPPDVLFPAIHAQPPPPTAGPPQLEGGVHYEHSISLGPNSNYYVYYSDNVQQQPQQQLSQPVAYQPLVGYTNEQSSQIMFNSNSLPVQLVTLVQPTVDAAIQQENATAERQLLPTPLPPPLPYVDINEEGIQKLVTSTQNLVTNEDVVSINNAEEDEVQSTDVIEETAKAKTSDSEPSESSKKENRLNDNIAVPSFDNPIVVGDTAEITPRNQRSGTKIDNLLKQINVEILGEADDHNKGQFLKETSYKSNQLIPEPCEDDGKSIPVEIKHEVTTIRPITFSTKTRGSTASRLSTRFRTTTSNIPSPTARYTAKDSITPKPVTPKYLPPLQAGLRLSNSDKNGEDCIDDNGSKTVVEVQKSINLKNLIVGPQIVQPTNQPEFGARTTVLHQPIIVEKPVDRIIKQNVFIEKPVERLVPQPVYIEKPVHHPVDRIVEKQVPVPYPVEKIVEKPVPTPVHVPYPVEKQVPVHHYVDRPVPHHIPIPVTVEKIVEKPVTIEKVITKEVQVPYPVTQIVEKIVDRPIPVEKVITKEVQVPYPVTQIVNRPYPVEVPVEKVVEKFVDRPVETVVEKHVEVPVPVTVEKVVEKFIDRPVPYPVQVPVEIPVQVPVHYPVEVPVGVPIPYAVEKLIPVTIHEPKPTHAIIKTTHHEKLFDFHKFFGLKKKHYTEHYFLKAPPLPKPPLIEAPGKHYYFHNQHPKNDLHFGASIAAPSYVDVGQINVLPHHFPEKSKHIYGTPLTGEVFNGKFTYQAAPLPPQPQPHHHYQTSTVQLLPGVYKDDYVGPTPLLEDHWAVKSDVKFRRSPTYGKSLRIEYGGFKPPLVPSLEIDENGVPLNKEQNAN